MKRTNPFHSLTSFVVAALLTVPHVVFAAAPKGRPAIPDFTRNEPIPAGAKHDWNLGPTGLRGWMYCDRMVTTEARQISVTQVEKGSPAEGSFVVGDVLLGVGGQPFSHDPRTEFGKAVTAAETEAGGGNLVLTRWRAGKTEEVVVKLPVRGSYGATAPFGCPKSKRILDQGYKALAAKVAKTRSQDDPIVRSVNALALLPDGRIASAGEGGRIALWAPGLGAAPAQILEGHTGQIAGLAARDGFLALARENPARMAVIDGARPPEQVARDVWQLVQARMGRAA